MFHDTSELKFQSMPLYVANSLSKVFIFYILSLQSDLAATLFLPTLGQIRASYRSLAATRHAPAHVTYIQLIWEMTNEYKEPSTPGSQNVHSVLRCPSETVPTPWNDDLTVKSQEPTDGRQSVVCIWLCACVCVCVRVCSSAVTATGE